MIALAVVKVPWSEALRGLLVPSIQWNGTFLTTLVALLGTTISPYLFIWQSSQEAEEQRIDPDKQPLKLTPSRTGEEFARIRTDTLLGMAFSNIIGIAIIITTANPSGNPGSHCRRSAADAAALLDTGIAADLGAMGDALRLLIGGPGVLYVAEPGYVSVLAQIFLEYRRYVAILKMAYARALCANGKTNIETSAQAAEALRPLAGVFAETIFALGIIGTGLLAIPVLAGSTAYAIGEGRRWPVGLSRKPDKAVAFYAVLAVSVLLGIGLNFTPLDPIKALYWSAVINGVLAPPVMVFLMLLVRKERVMGKLIVEGWLYWIGWIATAAMAPSIIGMGISLGYA